MFNLRFGNMNKTRQHTDEEVWTVWKLFGGHPKYHECGDIDVGTNGCKLGLADRVLVTLVRAVLSSVDFLLLASILDSLGEEASLNIMEVLRSWVSQRGLSQLEADHAAELSHRKKKTLFYTTKNSFLVKQCDAIVELLPPSNANKPPLPRVQRNQGAGLNRLKESLTKDMLRGSLGESYDSDDDNDDIHHHDFGQGGGGVVDLPEHSPRGPSSPRKPANNDKPLRASLTRIPSTVRHQLDL